MILFKPVGMDSYIEYRYVIQVSEEQDFRDHIENYFDGYLISCKIAVRSCDNLWMTVIVDGEGVDNYEK